MIGVSGQTQIRARGSQNDFSILQFHNRLYFDAMLGKAQNTNK